MQLKEALRRRFPDIAPHRLPGGFDRVGDIALIGMPPEARPHEREIGEILLDLHSTVQVVARRDGQYSGPHRLVSLTVIAGEQRLSTLHRENGIRLHLDLARVYFSGRSAHERARIAAQVLPGERVAVLCSGVGPFPLIIGRHSQAREVVGIEINPVAHLLAMKNRAANRHTGTVHFIEGDAAQVLPGLDGPFDRILIVLPYGGASLLPQALARLKPGGMLHLYAMHSGGWAETPLTAVVEDACRRAGRNWRLEGLIPCGHCGPDTWRVCLDCRMIS